MIVARGYGKSEIGSIVAYGLGLKPLDAAMQRSGVVRLWMYELYEESIKEDHKKRGIGEFAKEEVVQLVQTAPTVAKQVKKQPRRRAARRIEQPTPYPNLPAYAPVFTRNAESENLIAEIGDVLGNIARSPLKLIKLAPPKKPDVVIKAEIEKVIEEHLQQVKIETEIKIKRKKKREEEWFLLAA